MIGMNLIFHVVAALGIIALLWWIITLQKQRDLLVKLMNEIPFQDKRRVRLESPIAFLEKFCLLLGVPFESDLGEETAPVKIKADVFSKVFVEHGIYAIKCSRDRDQTTAEITLGENPKDSGLETKMVEALGGQIGIRIGVHK
jgi:hypothetical protein